MTKATTLIALVLTLLVPTALAQEELAYPAFPRADTVMTSDIVQDQLPVV